MTETLPRLEAPGDAELISAVRGGDLSAYGDLFERHVEAARRLARQLVGSADADDLVSDAFAKVMRVLQNGGGPDVAFRAYLLTAVRRLHVDKIRANAKLHTTDNLEMFDPGVPFRDTAVEGFESAAAAKAFASLPERWQAVLWHTEVEGQKPAEVAALLGMSPNSVSALAYRAREGLRQAFLNSHITDIEDDDCSWTHEHLGPYIRGGASKRDAAKVEKHIDECRKCMAIYIELTEVNNNLAAILAPLLLGSAGIGYLASAGVATKGALLLFLDRAKDTIAGNSQAAAVAGVAAAGVVVAGTVFALTAGGDDPTPTADVPAPPGRSAPVDPGSSAPPTAPPSDDPTDPIDSPTDTPSVVPTQSPTTTPTTTPTDEPTETPTEEPTEEPTETPTEEPVVESDLSFTSPPTAVQTAEGTYTVQVAVKGIPAGETVTVQTSSSTTSARTAQRQYLSSTSGTANGVTVDCPSNCVLTRSSPSLTLSATVTGDQVQFLTITLVPSEGFTDPNPRDNSTTLTLQPPAPAPTWDATITRGHVTQLGNSGKYTVPFTVSGLKPHGTATLTLTLEDLDLESVTGGEIDCTDSICTITDTGDGVVEFDVMVRVGLVAVTPHLSATLSDFSFAEEGPGENTAAWSPLLGIGGLLVL